MAKRMKEKTAKIAANKDTRPCAHAKFVRISPSKVRVVIDTVRGKSVNEALNSLAVTPKAASEVVYKLIQSAAANAEHNFEMNRDALYVKEAFVDGGPVMKRMMPRAQGRADIIKKRTSHITIVVGEK